jgi:hypothetical protein
MRAFASLSLLGILLVALVGCTEGLRGVPMKEPEASGRVVAGATTSEREGLKILWNGRTRGTDMKWKAWIAGSDDELAAVWSATAVGNPPSIDFAKYVVIAEAGEGGVCNPTIVGIEAEATGLLRLRYDPKDGVMTCIAVATRIAYVVAIPRRILPATVVFLHGYAFAVPEPPFGS